MINLNSLNDSQRSAVEEVDNPTLIVAGPGSGKTRTLIYKIANIVDKELASPKEILAITFTNKAVSVIKERLKEILKDEDKSSKINVFTYHSFCAYFLRVEANNINISSDYQILDFNSQKEFINTIISEKKDDKDNEETQSLTSSELINIFKEIKNKDENFDEAKKNFIKRQSYGMKLNSRLEETFKRIQHLYEEYGKRKKDSSLFDFDDLLYEVKKILSENTQLAKKWTEKFKYLFIDELQDTNNVQFDIVRSITNEDSKITVVGDPNQNIYSWRGANIRIILDFEKYYKNCKRFILAENYRSTKKIVEAANSLIKKNKDRIEMNLYTNNETGESVNEIIGNNISSEARQVVAEIKKLIQKGVQRNQISILYRANYLSASFEEKLAYEGISYKLIGGFRFYDRKEVKDVLNYLRFIFTKIDFNLTQVINVPLRKIGPATLSMMLRYSNENNISLWESLKTKYYDFNEKLGVFVSETSKLFSKIIKSNKPIDLIDQYLKKIGFYEFYEDNHDRVENIKMIIYQLKSSFEVSKTKSIFEFLENYLRNVSLMSSADEESEFNSINLSTGHSSKGTEYEYVFVVGFNEGIIPSIRSNTKSQIEEERRLAYVMITRAKKKLYISHSLEKDPSRFTDSLNMKDLDSGSFFRKKSNFFKDDLEKKKVPENFMKYKDAVKKIGDLMYPTRGDSVFHEVFGVGVIIEESDSTYTIAFERKYGIKEISKNYNFYIDIKQN